MNYNQALNKIHSFEKFGIRLGLERMSDLLCRLGNPQNDLKFIHVAGTNGKGSVSTMLSEIFIAEGKKTALYTSPFVISFRERMQINGDMISEEDLAKYTEAVVSAAQKMSDTPTEFEIVTAIALLYFKEQDCDIVVLEVGLGGIYDATNIIPAPLVSVITSISLDHTEYLGDTPASVAENKAGIIKENSPVVVSYGQADEVLEVIKRKAAETRSEVIICENETEFYNGKSFMYKGKRYDLSMLGVHQMQNAVTAVETASLLGAKSTSIYKGIKNARLPARAELVSRQPAVIIDGAHNLDGVSVLCRTVRRFFSDKKIISIVAMMEDKLWQESLLNIESISDVVIATSASNPRSLKAEQIGAYLHCEGFEDSRDAFKKALEYYDENSLILVCGSLYLASDLREYIIKMTK